MSAIKRTGRKSSTAPKAKKTKKAKPLKGVAMAQQKTVWKQRMWSELIKRGQW